MYTHSDKFPKYLCGFGKGYNAEHRLFVLIERMKEARDIKIKNEPQS